MTEKEKIRQYLDYKGISQNKFYKKTGLSIGFLNSGNTLGADKVKIIINNYPDINIEWLVLDKGSMLKEDVEDSKQISMSEVENYKGVGVPYYDVDFLGGFGCCENDQTVIPVSHINVPIYNNADSWVNVSGNSMSPLINHGDMIAIKKVEDWRNYILYGEVYGIVTEEYRTIKKIRKSEKGSEYLKLVPINPEFDEQDIEKSLIKFVYKVIGCVRRID